MAPRLQHPWVQVLQRPLELKRWVALISSGIVRFSLTFCHGEGCLEGDCAALWQVYAKSALWGGVLGPSLSLPQALLDFPAAPYQLVFLMF